MKQGPEEPVSNPGTQTWESSASLVLFIRLGWRHVFGLVLMLNSIKKKDVIYFAVRIVENFLP